jgi:integral membrane sensor domain MASE1
MRYGLAVAVFLAGIIAPALLVWVIDGFAFGAWFHGTVPDWTIGYALPLGVVGGIAGMLGASRLAAAA